ncbi:MAG: hypothetical protein LQ349_004581 [Xanthoria aureola]|nr:MAG: hypothetical protein LQ349_004581 [Xanthoria aureola]
MTHTATTQQAVVADALSATGALWFWSLTNVTANAGHGSPLSDQTNAAHRIDSDYRQPVSSVTCVPASVTNKTDSRHVVFPIFPYEEQSNANIQTVSSRDRTRQYKVIEHPTFMYSQLLDITGDVESYRLKWVELPPDKFNYSSIGLAILPPVSRSESASQTVVFCNIAASWGQSALEIETSGSGMGIAKSVVDDGKPTRARRHIGENQIPDAESWAANLGPSPIIILEDWARYLDPFIEELNATVFNVLMDSSNRTDPDRYLVSGVLSMLITNGLARTAWGSNLQGNVRVKGPNGHGPVDGDYWLANKGDVFQVDPVESRNWTSFVVESSLEGYAYNTLTVSPRIAIAIMMVYCLLVLGHTFYSGITGISSNCWDTIAEVTALAINSTPTAALRNTCAGISELHVFKLPVRILVSRDEEGEGEHLELVFGKIDDESAKARTIKPNTTYGTLPKGYIGEGKKDV